jgi:hypothetical protein
VRAPGGKYWSEVPTEDRNEREHEQRWNLCQGDRSVITNRVAGEEERLELIDLDEIGGQALCASHTDGVARGGVRAVE